MLLIAVQHSSLPGYVIPQGGHVDKSLNVATGNTKEALHIQKALKSLATSQVSELPELISKLDTDKCNRCVMVSEVKNVTSEFLAPVEKAQNEVPESPIIVYKGILRRLAGMKPSEKMIAILAGENMSVVNVVVSHGVEAAVGSPEVLEYWSKQGHEVMGLAVFEQISDPNQFDDTIRSLPGSHKQLLLLSSYGDNVTAWLTSRDDTSSTLVWSPVRVGMQQSNRKRNEKIRFAQAHKIGVTFDDEVLVF